MRGSSVSSMRGSVSSTSSSMSHAATSHPPTPPTSMIGPNTGTLRSAASPYRTPVPAVNPPTVPANYGNAHPLAGAGSMGPMRESGYAPGSASMQSTPPVRMVPPLQQQTSAYGSPLPPPMHDISQRPYISGLFALLATNINTRHLLGLRLSVWSAV